MDDAAKQEGSGGRPRIVVGVDGSEQSLAALRRGRRLAEAMGAELEAVCTWTFPAMATSFAFPVAPDLGEAAEETLREAVAEVFPEGNPPYLRTLVMQGHPAKELIELSEGAELLVLGSRGRGGFAGLLLGSVSSECAAHAKCPVLIMHHADE